MTSLWHSVTSFIHPRADSNVSRDQGTGNTDTSPGGEEATAGNATSSPSEGRVQVVGLEDPNAREVVDDPAIFDRSLPVIAAPPADGQPSKTLIDSTGKPFINPAAYGGSNVNKTAAEFGEPLNVIISAQSSPEILTRKGLQGYLRSLGLDVECLGLHSGDPTYAWLDPRGWVEENFLYREVHTPFDHIFGTCVESLIGGNHIRAYQQQGSGAWFFAASKEMNVTKHHMIVPDGYNIGRDLLVKETNQDKGGITSFLLKKYQTKVEYITGLMPVGASSINHGIAVDGRVALFTVTVQGSSRSKNKDGSRAVPPSDSAAKVAAKEDRLAAKRANRAQKEALKAQKKAEKAVKEGGESKRRSIQIPIPWKRQSAQVEEGQTSTAGAA